MHSKLSLNKENLDISNISDDDDDIASEFNQNEMTIAQSLGICEELNHHILAL